MSLFETIRQDAEEAERQLKVQRAIQDACVCSDALARLRMLELYKQVTCKLCGKLYSKLPAVPEIGGAFLADHSEELGDWIPMELGGEDW
jgi:hypothetical protein